MNGYFAQPIWWGIWDKYHELLSSSSLGSRLLIMLPFFFFFFYFFPIALAQLKFLFPESAFVQLYIRLRKVWLNLGQASHLKYSELPELSFLTNIDWAPSPPESMVFWKWEKVWTLESSFHLCIVLKKKRWYERTQALFWLKADSAWIICVVIMIQGGSSWTSASVL